MEYRRTKAIINSNCGSIGDSERYGSIGGCDVVMVVPIWWLGEDKRFAVGELKWLLC